MGEMIRTIHNIASHHPLAGGRSTDEVGHVKLSPGHGVSLRLPLRSLSPSVSSAMAARSSASPRSPDRIQGEQRMSVRVHTTTAPTVIASVIDNPEINDTFGFFESPLPAGRSLVIDDPDNLEALVLAGTEDELFEFAKRVRDAVLTGSLYAENKHVVRIRFYPEETAHGIEWTIDGEDHAGRYTEACWTYDTLDEALGEVGRFITEHDLFRPELEPEPAPPIATAAELRAALDGLDDDAIVLTDESVYIGPRSARKDD